MEQQSLPSDGRGRDERRIGSARSPSDGWDRRLELDEGIWPTLLRSDDAGRRRTLGLVQRAAFDSDDHPDGSRVDACRHLLAAQARAVPLSEPFRARAVVYSLGDLSVALFEGVPHRFERDRAKIVFDEIDGVAVHHLVRGRVAGSFDGREVAVGEGGIYGIDMAKPATIEERGAMRSIRVSLKRRAASGALPGIDRLHGATLDRHAAEPYLRVLYRLVRRLDALQAADAPHSVAELVGALARCLESAVAPRDPLAERRSAMVDFIDGHVADRRLTPDFIAASLHISRTTLFAAFRDWGGVERVIVARRLDRARMILRQTGPRPSVARLAQLCGFSSPEHFARVFRQCFGSSPSRYVEDGGAVSPRGDGGPMDEPSHG